MSSLLLRQCWKQKAKQRCNRRTRRHLVRPHVRKRLVVWDNVSFDPVGAVRMYSNLILREKGFFWGGGDFT